MQRLELLDILDLAKPALAAKDFIPIFTYFCFDRHNVFAYNDLVGIQVPCETPISGAVAGERLMALLRTHESGKVNFKQDSSGEELQIKVGNVTWIRLPFLPPDDFLFEFPQIKTKFKIILNDSFVEGLKSCLVSSSEDTSRPDTMGITLVLGEQIILYSTDNQTLTEYFVDMDGIKSEADRRVLVLSSDFCSVLLSLYRALDEGEEAILYIEKKHLIAEFGDCLAYCRLSPFLTPPDHAKTVGHYLKGVRKKDFISIPKGFSGALERSVLLLDPAQRSICDFSISEGSLTLSTSSYLGKSRDLFKLKVALVDIAVLVDPRFLLRVMDFAESMCFKKHCVILRGGANYLHLVTAQPE